MLRCSGRVSQLQTGPAPGLLSHTTAILCASSLHLSTALPVFIFLQPLVVGSGPPVPSPHSLGCSWLLLWTRPPQTLLPVTASGDPRLSRLPHSGASRALCWWCHATAQFSRPPEAVPCSTGSPVTFLSGEMPPDPANPRSDGARCMKRTWHHLCSFPVCSICPGLTPLFFFFKSICLYLVCMYVFAMYVCMHVFGMYLYIWYVCVMCIYVVRIHVCILVCIYVCGVYGCMYLVCM